MNAEQRTLFTQMQATMCIVEGYPNHVMNAVGRELLPNYEMISRRFAQRLQQRSQADRLRRVSRLSTSRWSSTVWVRSSSTAWSGSAATASRAASGMGQGTCRQCRRFASPSSG